MDGIKKRNSRKKPGLSAVAILGALCLGLAASLVISLAALIKKQEQLDGLIRQNFLLMEDMEKGKEAGEDSSHVQEEALGQAPKSQKDVPEDLAEKPKESEDPAETKDPMITEDPKETEQPKETEPLYLENLSGLAPGTVILAEQLDFSNLGNYFMFWELEEGDNLHKRINGKSYRDNPYVPLSSLRYVKLLHYNFDGNIQVGELIINQDILQDVLEIFTELFQAKYQIQSMYLVDNYWTGDPDTTDTASIDVNNTSAFCYREITGGGRLSNHAYGRAIDLNPQQNPYVSYSTGTAKWYHSNADDYIARDTGLPHVITHDDLAYRLFTERGFQWGGDWNNPKDYQHFDKNSH